MTTPLLLIIGFVAGLLTIVSPCILPVLPAVIASGIDTGGRRRALAIATGLALAFGFTTLFSIRVFSALHLPLTLRDHIAEGALFVLAIAFIVPKVGELLERPFARIGLNPTPDATGSGFVLGATLGLLYLPCGGPILSAITAVGQKNGTFGFDAIVLTIAYSLGIALPVFALVLMTTRLTSTTAWLRTHGAGVRRAGGVLLLVSALAITFGATTSLQKDAPSFTASVERHLTNDHSVKSKLAAIQNPHETQAAKRIQRAGNTDPVSRPSADQVPVVPPASLPSQGPAPQFTGITKWINTPNGSPISLSQLHGKVVLLDFWTYSCINCLRSLPHVEAWYSRYHHAGLDVIGVHTPEFDFEHVASNVQAAVKRLGVTYPVAMDNDYGTWNAWGNDSWPAEYLIDPSGNVRYVSIGESDYGVTEGAIRGLLKQNGATLPPTTDVPNRTPTELSTPESYLGYERLARYDGTPIVHDQAANYTFASTLPANHLTYSGQWTVQSQDIAAGAHSALRINVSAEDVYLVLSGSGTVTATLDGKPLHSIDVTGVPKLYPILSGTTTTKGVIQLNVPAGVKAYAFTFG